MIALAIISREKYCARLLEFFKTMNYKQFAYTAAKEFDNNSLAVFIFRGTEDECRDIEMWIRGTYNTFDVLAYRFVGSADQLFLPQ